MPTRFGGRWLGSAAARYHPSARRGNDSTDSLARFQTGAGSGVPTRLDALKREWAKASPAERAEFVSWAEGRLPPRPAGSPLPGSLIGPDGFLLPEVIDRIEAIMVTPGPFGPGKSQHGRIMSAMGYQRSSTRLANALLRRGKPDSDFLDRLRAWIAAAEKG